MMLLHNPTHCLGLTPKYFTSFSCFSKPNDSSPIPFSHLSFHIYHRMILLFFASCLLQNAITVTTPTNETDHLVLLKFKESIPRDPYNILSSWNDSMHYYNWHGITWPSGPKSHGFKPRGL